MSATIYIDGASRGNPGPAAFAFVLQVEGGELIEEKGLLGNTTNNVAEYMALIHALEKAVELRLETVHILSDSLLLVQQMNGSYKVKNLKLLPLFDQAKTLARQLKKVSLAHVRRELNHRADQLCNQALDGPSRPGQRELAVPKKFARANGRVQAAHQEAIECLQAAASAWTKGNAADPPALEVWNQLWSILEENGVVKT